MDILNSESELLSRLSPNEQHAYLSTAWDDSPDMTIDTVHMAFKSPAEGSLSIQGGHKIGESNYIIKLATVLNDEHKNLILLGDAKTGVITAILPDKADCPLVIDQVNWTDIQARLKSVGADTVNQLQKDGFENFSSGSVTIPDVLYMPFFSAIGTAQDGDLHLKGAHSKGGEIFVMKIATGFTDNAAHGLSTHQGVMMAFDATTATPLTILKDEGHLTDLRTAIAGRNAAEALMPQDAIKEIGVLGSGVQARLQIKQLESLYPHCRNLTVWGRTPAKATKYAYEMQQAGWSVTLAETPKDVAKRSNLIITTTAADSPLLDVDDIAQDNTLIIAIGADMPGKSELSPALLKAASNIIVDSISQSKDHGNAAQPIADGIVNESDLQEYGDFLKNGLKNPEGVSNLRVFLSSGIGVQDLQIVQAVISHG